MTKAKKTAPAQSPKQMYEGFIKDYGSWLGAQEHARGIRSENVGARTGARDYALKCVDEILGLKDVAGNPISQADVLKSDATVDTVLRNAINYHGEHAQNRFTADLRHILDRTPDKGLAGIVLDHIPPVELKGKDKYAKASEAHSAYMTLLSKLPKDDEDMKVKHEDLYKTLMPFVADRIGKQFEGDEYAKDSEDLIRDTVNAASFVLASSGISCLNGVRGLVKAYKKEFEEYLPEDKDKAKYARKTLRVLAGEDSTRGIAMQSVYMAHKKAQK
jgi:hypothetical protein